MPPTLTGARVVVVSGKGGVGKTTVAAALAVAAAGRGRRVLLLEIEDRESFAPLFGLRRLEYTEKQIDDNLWALAAIADEALVEYLRVMYGVPKLSRTLVRSKVVEFATNTAPGLRDILLIGTVMESERRRRDGHHAYDLIVVDAPPTGRLPRFLDAPRATAELVRAGPIRSQAQIVLDLVLDPKRLQVVLVALPEDMPVRETAETAETLRKMGIALGPVVVNGVWPELKGLGKDAAATLRARASDAGLALGDDAVGRLAEVASAHARRARHQRGAIKTLAADVPLPQVQLPFLFTRQIGRAELDVLASELEESL